MWLQHQDLLLPCQLAHTPKPRHPLLNRSDARPLPGASDPLQPPDLARIVVLSKPDHMPLHAVAAPGVKPHNLPAIAMCPLHGVPPVCIQQHGVCAATQIPQIPAAHRRPLHARARGVPRSRHRRRVQPLQLQAHPAPAP